MNEIVKYHNDFNKISLPSFNELQNNLLFGIIQKVRDKGNQKVEFKAHELNEFVKNRGYTNKELFSEVCHLKNNFFKADFTILLDGKDKDEVGIQTINLFKTFAVYYISKKEVDKKKEFVRFTRIELEVNPEFAYLINELTAHFTRFELVEFIALSGKYTKTLYRLLKQYRTTGLMEMEWNEFRRIMDVPESYEMRDIEKQILKPAVKELTAERNLFDSKRIPFKNLSYKKLGKNGKENRQGEKVRGIQFTFLPQIKDAQELEKAQKNLDYLANQKKRENRVRDLEKRIAEKQLSKESIESFRQEYLNRNILTYNEMTGKTDTSKITDLIIEPDKITIMLKNADTAKNFSLKFENRKNHSMNKMLLSFANWFEKNKAE